MDLNVSLVFGLNYHEKKNKFFYGTRDSSMLESVNV